MIRVGVDGRAAILQDEASARLEDARDFSEREIRVHEVVRRDPAGRRIEALVGEVDRLGVHHDGADVLQSTGAEEPPRALDHLRRDVDGDHLANLRRDRDGGVPRAGRHVEHSIADRRFEHP